MKKRVNSRIAYLSILIFIGIFIFILAPIINNFLQENKISLSPPITVYGKSEVVVSDMKDGTSYLSYFIHIQNSNKYTIIDPSGIIPKDLASGEDIKVVGDFNPNGITLGSGSSFSRIGIVEGGVASVQKGNINTGEQKTLVVPIYTSSTPINLPLKSEIISKIFDLNNPNSLNSWIKEVSYNRAWLTGDVLDWIHANAGEIYCNPDDMRNSQFFENNNIDIEPYTRLIIIFEEGTCENNLEGIANIGIPEFNLEDTKIWLSTSLVTKPGNIDNGVLHHEFGHNLGLLHSNAWDCNNLPPSVGPCTSANYGDPIDIMGSYLGKAHFNSLHKDKIGWLKQSQIQNYNPKQGNYTIEPIEIVNGTKMIKIPLSDGSFYSIEYRRPIGQDFLSLTNPEYDDWPNYIYQGARIYWQKESNDGDAQLLDLTLPPASGGLSGGGIATAILPVGQTFTDSVNQISITTLEANENYLKINITGNIDCGSGHIRNPNGQGCIAIIPADPQDAELSVYGTNGFGDLWARQSSDMLNIRSSTINIYSNIYANSIPPSQSTLSRSILSFDTRALPLNSVIRSAKLSLFTCSFAICTYNYPNTPVDYLTIQKKALPSTPLVTPSDFISYGESLHADTMQIESIPTNDRTDFNLNDEGKDWINKSKFTDFMLRSSYDYGAPIPTPFVNFQYSFYSSNDPIVSHHPLLIINYTLPSNTCGNGILESGEQCDDMGTNSNRDLCTDQCTLTHCGDGTIQRPNGEDKKGALDYGYEECDSIVGCNANCTLEDDQKCSSSSPVPCNNRLQGCYLDSNACQSCSALSCEQYGTQSDCLSDKCSLQYDCTWYSNSCHTPTCGDGQLSSGESCDSNMMNDCITPEGYLGQAQCNLQCTNIHTSTCTSSERCGDGIINGQEICDDGTQNGQPNKCNAYCSGPTNGLCPNGIVEANEQCEDGNTNNGDNCRNNCVNNTCGDGYFNYLSEQCDDGNINNADFCKNDCKINTVCNSTTCTIKIPSVSLDGFIRAESIGGNNGDFNNLRSLSSGSYVDQYNSNALMQLRNAHTPYDNSEITRVILPFKTSIIPTTINIQSANVEIHQSVMSATASSSSLNYIKLAKVNLAQPPNYGIADYDELTTLSPISVSIFQGSSGINNLALSELSWINRGSNAWTVLGIRGGYDITGLAPNIYATLQIYYHPADGNYATYPTPQLVITFPAGCNNGIIDAGEQCELGMTSTCLTQPSGLSGNRNCSSTCQWNNCIAHSTTGTAPGPRACFAKDTKISTPTRKVNIQDIQIGDEVISYNEKTKQIENSKVVQVFKHQVSSYLIINNKLKVTKEHPMLINEKWKEIGSANIDDKIKTINNEEIIKSIEEIKDSVEVFNLEVENNHNYFAENFLVHNKGPLPPGLDIQ